jgi:hypothetical protein
MRMRIVPARAFAASLWLALLALVAGCATTTGPAPSSGSRATPPVARYNLAGYSEGFKQGYADACASRRSAERYKSDVDYQMGWNDGQSLCKK